MRRSGAGRALAGLAVVTLLGACSSAGSSAATGSTTSTRGRATTRAPLAMHLTSPAFADGGPIPTEYTCSGEGVVPDLAWSAPPPGTEGLALLVFDPDAGPDGFVHFLRWDISPAQRAVTGGLVVGGTPGMNGRGGEQWVAPCPPAGNLHHYQFTLFALDRAPQIAPTANVTQFLAGIRGRVIATGRLTGTYER